MLVLLGIIALVDSLLELYFYSVVDPSAQRTFPDDRIASARLLLASPLAVQTHIFGRHWAALTVRPQDKKL